MGYLSAYLNGTVGNPNRSGIGRITFVFDAATTIGAVTDLVIKNRNTGAILDITSATLSGNGTTEVTWVLESVSFANGYYSASLPKTAATPNLTSTAIVFFHKLTGDVNGDGVVSGNDYIAVNQNIGLSGVKFRAGDAGGNGTVSGNDYITVNLNIGQMLTVLAGKKSKVVSLSRRRRVRV